MTDSTVMSILRALQLVLRGEASFQTLQKLVDKAVIEDELSDQVSEDIRSVIYDLQTALELIAEQQATHAGTASVYSDEQIIALLQPYSRLVRN
jgi:hypothetical protein